MVIFVTSDQKEMNRVPEQEKQSRPEQSKRQARDAYVAARDRTAEAYNVVTKAWAERIALNDELGRAYTALSSAIAEKERVWGDYDRLRTQYGSRIQAIRIESTLEHQEALSYSARAKNCFNSNERTNGYAFVRLARLHREKRDALNAEVKQLIAAIKEARIYAEQNAPIVDSSQFQELKARYHQAKKAHLLAEDNFKKLKSERDSLKIAFSKASKARDFLKSADSPGTAKSTSPS